MPELTGRFRVEGSAIFDVSRRFKLSPRKDVKKVVDDIRSGKGVDVKLPAAPQQKRLGQYRKLGRGRLRLDLDDKESLNGIMIIWRKKNTSDVWLGTYAEKQGTRTVRDWQVELRPIED